MEELPVGDLDSGIEQLKRSLVEALAGARLTYAGLSVQGTPRRLVAQVVGLAARQPDLEQIARGPALGIAYDAAGEPTRAAAGFARSRGVDVAALQQRDFDGKPYVVALTLEQGRGAATVLSEVLPRVCATMRFGKSMHWNESGLSFSRPIRWIVALFGDQVVPFEYAGVQSGRTTRGIRPGGSQPITLAVAADYESAMEREHSYWKSPRARQPSPVRPPIWLPVWEARWVAMRTCCAK